MDMIEMLNMVRDLDNELYSDTEKFLAIERVVNDDLIQPMVKKTELYAAGEWLCSLWDDGVFGMPKSRTKREIRRGVKTVIERLYSEEKGADDDEL